MRLSGPGAGWREVLAALRQARAPAAFRISPGWIAAAIERTQARAVAAAPLPQGPAEEPEPPPAWIAELCTGLFRLRQKLLDPQTGRPLEATRRAYRHLESAWDALAREGVEILDHTDAPFDSGLALRVLAYQPTPGALRERVIETVKPSVYYRGRPLQLGEVIVATPLAREGLAARARTGGN